MILYMYTNGDVSDIWFYIFIAIYTYIWFQTIVWRSSIFKRYVIDTHLKICLLPPPLPFCASLKYSRRTRIDLRITFLWPRHRKLRGGRIYLHYICTKYIDHCTRGRAGSVHLVLCPAIMFLNASRGRPKKYAAIRHPDSIMFNSKGGHFSRLSLAERSWQENLAFLCVRMAVFIWRHSLYIQCTMYMAI